jgi:hypothetical protein
MRLYKLDAAGYAIPTHLFDDELRAQLDAGRYDLARSEVTPDAYVRTSFDVSAGRWLTTADAPGTECHWHEAYSDGEAEALDTHQRTVAWVRDTLGLLGRLPC